MEKAAPEPYQMILRYGDSQTELRLDCRHYQGDRPCKLKCDGSCRHHAPMGHRILIIKLGALGDVIRTEALLPGLKDAYPVSHITWISRGSGCRVLANNPLIDRLLEFDAETLCHIEYEQFDLVISLDKEPGPAALAMRVNAPDKRGIGLSGMGTAFPLNEEAHYYFALGLSNHLKFEVNQFSYQKLIYQAVGLNYQGQRYAVYPGQQNLEHAFQLLARHGVSPNDYLVGLNTGAGTVFANKTWKVEMFEVLARRFMARPNCRVALLGGPQEVDKHAYLAKMLGPAVIDTGCHNSELDFAAIVSRCRVLLTGDTTAMHLGIAQRIPTVVLLGPTCSQEIDLYGRGVKLISRVDCAPCYRRTCDLSPNCMDLIAVEQAEAAMLRYLNVGEQTANIDTPSMCEPTFYHTTSKDDGGVRDSG